MGAAAFAPLPPEKQPSGAKRQVLIKPGKAPGENNQYVQDDRGVFTRRYAYVEKADFQVRSLISQQKWEGQYQQKQDWLGEVINKFALDKRQREKFGFSNQNRTMSQEQMALLHQEKGSGVQQRGASLRSTPKEIYGNAGESFRSAGGVLVKVDLARVPRGKANLLNHYSAGGIKDVAHTLKTAGTYQDTGAYVTSVTKNREIYVDTLTPDMFVAMTHHGGKGDQALQLNQDTKPQELLNELAQITGYSAYVKGYQQGAWGIFSPKEDSPQWDKGLTDGREFKKGYDVGLEESNSRFAQKALTVEKLGFLQENTGWNYARGYAYGYRGNRAKWIPFRELPAPAAQPTQTAATIAPVLAAETKPETPIETEGLPTQTLETREALEIAELSIEEPVIEESLTTSVAPQKTEKQPPKISTPKLPTAAQSSAKKREPAEIKPSKTLLTPQKSEKQPSQTLKAAQSSVKKRKPTQPTEKQPSQTLKAAQSSANKREPAETSTTPTSSSQYWAKLFGGGVMATAFAWYLWNEYNRLNPEQYQ